MSEIGVIGALQTAMVAGPASPYRNVTVTRSVGAGGAATWGGPIPPGTLGGDILKMYVTADGSGSSLPVTPSGWSADESTGIASPDGQDLSVFSKVAAGTAGLPTTETAPSSTFTGGGSHSSITAIVAWNKDRWTSFSDVAIASNTTDNSAPVTATCPTVTASVGNAIVRAVTMDNPTAIVGSAGIFVKPAGYFEICNVVNPADGFSSLGLYYQIAAASGSAGTLGIVDNNVVHGGWLAYTGLMIQ